MHPFYNENNVHDTLGFSSFDANRRSTLHDLTAFLFEALHQDI